MKAAQINRYGGKEALKMVDTPKPQPEPGQVLLEVRAAGVNPFDWKVREGFMKDFLPMELPATLGGDIAGIVAEVGTKVTDFEVGQAVFGQANAAGGKGSFAEFSPVSAGQLALKPEGIDFETAAALPLAATSAYQALKDHAAVQSGQKVLIHGGAGGIGSFAVQIAKSLGAYVATTATQEDYDFVISLGADQVIDYRKEAFDSIIKDFDVVFDTIGGETNRKSYGVLRLGGILVSMVDPEDSEAAAKAGIRYIHQGTKVTTQRLEEIGRLAEAGELKVNISKVFPLEEAGEALAYIQEGKQNGKVVIKVS